MATDRSCSHGRHAGCQPAILCHRRVVGRRLASAPPARPRASDRCGAATMSPSPTVTPCLAAIGLEVVGEHRPAGLDEVDAFRTRHVDEHAPADDAVGHLGHRAPHRAELGVVTGQKAGRCRARHSRTGARGCRGASRSARGTRARRTPRPRRPCRCRSSWVGHLLRRVTHCPVDDPVHLGTARGLPKAVTRSRAHDTARPAVTRRAAATRCSGSDQVQGAALVIVAPASPVRAAVDVQRASAASGWETTVTLLMNGRISRQLSSPARPVRARRHHPIR